MRYTRIAFFFLLLLKVSQVSADTKAELTFLVWEDFIHPDILEQWYEQTGVPIKQVLFDDESQNNLILSGPEAKHIDVAIVPSSGMQILTDTDQLHPVQTAQDRALFWPDACGEYGQQYAWGAYGIVYRTDKLNTPLTHWKDLLSPAPELEGHIGMLGQSDELIGSALLALGLSPSSNKTTDLKKAFELLRQQTPSVVTYEYIYTYVSGNPTKNNVWAASAYSGDEVALNELQETSAWTFVLPEDGALIWIDCLVIPSRSTLKVQAQQFIDFVSQSQISASNSEYLSVETPFVQSHHLKTTHNDSIHNLYRNAEQCDQYERFSNFKGLEILQRTRIKDALMRYHDTH